MKVIGYGDNVVDRYINQNIMYPGGNCVNFAVYAKQLNINAAYLGCFGEDEEAQIIKEAFDDMGIDYSYCKEEKGTVTERCDVDLIQGDRVFRGEDDRNNLHGALPLGKKEISYLTEFDLIHCSCYAKVEGEISELKDMPGLISFDFAVEEEFRTDEYLEQICPFIDFALFSCEHMKKKEIYNLLHQVHKKGVSYVLATMGTKGQILFDGIDYCDGVVHLKKAIDTMGAGDSFVTSFLISLLQRGWKKGFFVTKEKIQEAFEYAAEFSANNCLLHGAFGYGKPIKF